MASMTLSENPVAAEPRIALGLAESFAKVPVTLQVILGSARIPLSELLSLQAGSSITLDQSLGEPVVVMVNGCKVAIGQLIVVDEQIGKLGVKILEIFTSKDPT